MTTAPTSRLTTRLASALTALVMTITVNGGMLMVFNEAAQGDAVGAVVVAHSTGTQNG